METLNQQVLTDERALTPTVRDVLAIGYRPPKDRSLAPTVRDVVAIGFRHRKLLTISFIAVLLAVVLPAVLMPKYEAEMKILVRHERMDPIITADQQQPNVQQQLAPSTPSQDNDNAVPGQRQADPLAEHHRAVNALYLLLDDRFSRKVRVGLGSRHDNLIVIKEGLGENDRVAVGRLKDLRDGMKVQPVKSDVPPLPKP